MTAIFVKDTFFTLTTTLLVIKCRKTERKSEMTTLEIISLIVGVIEIAIALICLRWFYLKMTSMEQNQQILIDELEALRKELKERND